MVEIALLNVEVAIGATPVLVTFIEDGLPGFATSKRDHVDVAGLAQALAKSFLIWGAPGTPPDQEGRVE